MVYTTSIESAFPSLVKRGRTLRVGCVLTPVPGVPVNALVNPLSEAVFLSFLEAINHELSILSRTNLFGITLP